MADHGATSEEEQRRFTQRYLEGHMPWDSGITPPEVMAFLGANPTPGSALDLGCGTGTNAITLALHGWQVIGIDFVAQAIAMATAKAHEREEAIASAGGSIRLLLADVTRIVEPLTPGLFTYILDLGCLNSIPEGDRPALAALVAAQATPGALFMLFAHLPRDDRPGPRGCTPEELDALFAAAFTLEKRIFSGDIHGGQAMWNWYRRKA